jgi:hypothetical protein
LSTSWSRLPRCSFRPHPTTSRASGDTFQPDWIHFIVPCMEKLRPSPDMRGGRTPKPFERPATPNPTPQASNLKPEAPKRKQVPRVHDLTHDGQHWGADVNPIPKLWAIRWDFVTTLQRHVTSLNHLASPPLKCRKYRGSLRKPGPARALFRTPNPEA